MENPDYEAPVKMNPLGPHYYVEDDYFDGPERRYEFPESWRDALVDRMYQIMLDLDDEHSWPITAEFIHGHTEITTVQWNEDGDDFEIQPFEVSMDWYSRSQLREYDDF